MVFIRYDISEGDDDEYISSQFINFLKLNKYIDIEEYKLLSESNNVNEIFIAARYHLQLLDKDNEYEDYGENFYINRKKCQGAGCSAGCCSKEGGCASGGGSKEDGGLGGGNCESYTKQCCKK